MPERFKQSLARFTERLVDRATDAGHPPPADVVLRLKDRGLLKPDNEIDDDAIRSEINKDER